MARPPWRPEPTTNTMLVLFRDRRGRVTHVVIGVLERDFLYTEHHDVGVADDEDITKLFAFLAERVVVAPKRQK